MHKTIAVLSTSSEKNQAAEELATRLGLNYISNQYNTHRYAYLLVMTPQYLGLQKTNEKKFNPFFIDFLSGKIRYRSKQAGRAKELLVRAMGVNPGYHPKIIDATAGLGRDSFILATVGYEVTMLERSAIIFSLLEDALERAKEDPQVSSIVNRLHLIHDDALNWFKSLPSQAYPEIIYLDPMFPKRQKSASSKKEMTILQNLLGNEANIDIFLETALACATSRVVIKRPRLAPIYQYQPNFFLMGKSSRFDIHLK